MSDLEIIKELEKEIGFKLEERSVRPAVTGYTLDTFHRVINLSMHEKAVKRTPYSVFKLTYLEFLRYTPRPRLTSLPPEICKLIKLKKLDLQHNNLTYIPEEIGQLNKLEKLHLENNQLTFLPPEIGQLNKLSELYLEHNQLTALPPEIGQLNKLEKLFLGDNNLTTLPREIGQLNKLTELVLGDNPLTTPPLDIAEQGVEAIKYYFDQIEKEKGETQYLHESKLLIIGDGGTGKTTFRRKIINPDCDLPNDNETTRGIDVDKWEFPTHHSKEGTRSEVQYHVNLWDFGGQELYRGTHQMFFSEKSYYVLVADTRKQATDYAYWLNTVLQLAGTDSSVLILLNKKHGHEIKFDEEGYRGYFGGIIKDVISLDLGEEIGAIHDLQGLVKAHLKQLPGIGDKLPPSWVQIREDLAKERTGLIIRRKARYISFGRFQEICAKYDITDEGKIETLSTYYTRIGVFTHYIKDPLLRDRVYLDSNWLMETVYKILENEEIKQKEGRLTAADIRKIWGKNNLGFETDRLATLMHKFGLMYQVDNSDSYVVPEHLPSNQPYKKWSHDGSSVLHFVYEFNKYMPHGLLSRLIVTLHDYIENHKHVWLRGVNIAHENTQAEITESYGAENSFKIRITGANKEGLLFIIREAFAKVLKPFKNLKYGQMVPCQCSVCEGSEEPGFHDLNKLLNMRGKRSDTICDLSSEDIEINKLLQITDYNPEEEDQQPEVEVDHTTLETIKLFLASSSELEGDRKEIGFWLTQKNNALRKKGYYVELVVWEYFLDAMSKTRLQDEYNKALMDCEVVVCLFETKLGEFTEEEFNVAYKSFDAGNKPNYLYTYFKGFEIKSTDMDLLKQVMELNAFKERLQELGHYPTPYESTPALLKHLGEQLDLITEKMQ